MIKLVEPVWGVNISKALFAWMQASPFWYHWMPIFADIFVLSYPIYLLALYGYGMVIRKKGAKVEGWKSWLEYKTSAIYIFVGTFLTAVFNVLVQYFFDKARPNVVLGLADLKHETILHRFLPSSSFRSCCSQYGDSYEFPLARNPEKRYKIYPIW